MMAQRRAGGSGIPTNQIWYESYSGQQVTPYNTAAFGIARIVSNTFEGESGVISFDTNVPQVGSNAFFNCAGLSTVTLPDTVKGDLGGYAFCQCSSLFKINLPKGITTIGDYAFYSCYLDSLELPPRLESIGNFAFAYNGRISSVEIPRSVKSIGDNAFDHCTGVRTLTLRSSVPPTLGANAFSWMSSYRIWIPAGSKDAYVAAPNWSSFKNYFDEY